MRWGAELFARFRRLPPEPQDAEEHLARAMQAAHPPVEVPEGLAQRIERAALREARRSPRRFRRPRLAVPATAAAALALLALMWYTPALRAYQIAQRMSAAWQSVRDYQAEGVVTAPILGRSLGTFRVKAWYQRPGRARADFAGKGIAATFLVDGNEARLRVPALGWDYLVPMKGEFVYLRDLAEVGRTIRRLEEVKELRLVGLAPVANQECYVLQYDTRSLLGRARRRLGLDAQVSKEMGQAAVSGKVWVSTDTLLPLKAQAYDAEGGTVVTAEFRNVSLNRGVDHKLFAAPGREKAMRTEAYTWEGLLREFVRDAEDLWRGL